MGFRTLSFPFFLLSYSFVFFLDFYSSSLLSRFSSFIFFYFLLISRHEYQGLNTHQSGFIGCNANGVWMDGCSLVFVSITVARNSRFLLLFCFLGFCILILSSNNQALPSSIYQ